MAYIVKKTRETITYDTSDSPTSTFPTEEWKVTRNDDGSLTYRPLGRENTHTTNVPRRCSRCRKYVPEDGTCRLGKDRRACRKSYSIKKNK